MRFCFLAALAVAALAVPAPAVTLDLKTARLVFSGSGVVERLEFPDGRSWPGDGRPAFVLDTERGPVPVESLTADADGWHARFADGSTADFTVATAPGVAVVRLTRLQPRTPVQGLRLFHLAVPEGARILGILNGAQADGRTVLLLAGEPNVLAQPARPAAAIADRTGCRHEFAPTATARAGRQAARFTASCDARPTGWSMRGKDFPVPRDLTGCRALRAWVHGDGKGEHLKIQLFDGQGGYRDNYLPIDFQGWRQVTLTECPINTLRYNRVTALNFYYNGLPANQTVTCLIDHVEALLDRGGKTETVLLEDFESADSPLWSQPRQTLTVSTQSRHGLQPAAFALVVCPTADLWHTLPRAEKLAGLPSPHPGGAWNKRSPWTRDSYLFLTDFRESQFDEALALARRGGFRQVLLGQESWCRSTGHYEIPRDRFPDGLNGLARTVRRFHDAGIRVGLHFLGPSIYPPDPYLTPVPDSRLVKGAAATLAADVDEKAGTLLLAAAPRDFPAEDGGYEGKGTVLQVGDELVAYSGRSLEAPFAFTGCRRGHLGTRPASHTKGDPVRHLVRAYGYHMFDMDTSLLDEASAHFARVANATGIDMIYFDGSENLQGDHWYYNARLHKAFWDKLTNKDVFLQASSFSHYSWHLLARTASADGHGDLKGYLDERSGYFDPAARDGMPLDVGWYYGYDPNQPLDMYEYVLGATLGYDSSMSYQVSLAAARAHPFTGALLDRIARYEKLRLSGRVPEQVRALFRIDPALAGVKRPEDRAKLLDRRREYRLVGPEGKEAFQRVVFEPWHDFAPADTPTWTAALKDGPARVGFQLHLPAAKSPRSDKAALADIAVTVGSHRLAWKGTLREGEYLLAWPGEPVRRYAPGKMDPEEGPALPEVVLTPGSHSARLESSGPRTAALRVRLTFEPAERRPVPPAPPQP